MKYRRTMIAYAMTTSLVMMLSLGAWMAIIMTVSALESDPELEKKVVALTKEHDAGSPELEEALGTLYEPVFRPYPWIAIRLVAGLLLYALGGFIVGFWSRDPRWAGALPLVTLASVNPAVVQVPGLGLPSFAAMVGLFASQMLAVYGAASLGARMRMKATPR